MDFNIFRLCFFFIMLILCVYLELQAKPLSWQLTLFGTLMGFFLAFQLMGIHGLINAGLGALVGWVPFYIAYRMNTVGPGEVGVMGMVGALGGFQFVIHCYLYTALVGVVMAFFVLWRSQQLGRGLQHSFFLLGKPFMSAKKWKALESKWLPTQVQTIRYNLAIVGGAYIAFFTQVLQ